MGVPFLSFLSDLKLKLIGSIVAISGIAVLKFALMARRAGVKDGEGDE